MAPKIKYTDAFDELQQIVADIESGQISIDELSDKVRRATLVIGICKDKLHNTEEDINKILQDLDKEDPEALGGDPEAVAPEE